QFSDKQVVVVVYAVNEVISLQSGQIDAAPGMVSHNRKTEYIKGLAKLEERVIIMLDLGRVLSHEDIVSMGDITQVSDTGS
ncbi:MAG: chemotaxis protein CheW, partial [Leptospiraceae bacterium]|nr:chemotaxis protein CheW [Leptospiraceae bacterium]